MKWMVSVGAALALIFITWTGEALACGGAFGMGFELGPDQEVVIDHAEGVERYVLNPHFCGAATDFGLILPVPTPLEGMPELVTADIYRDLDDYTAPEVQYETVCRGGPQDGSAWDTGTGVMDTGGGSDTSGATVIDTGTVGQFDWVLLQADTAAAFTDWLDTHGYPYEAAANQIFTHYVDAGWYFVAFKVTAGDEALPAGSYLCGDLAPLSVSFAAEQPVVPSRIALVGEPYQEWRAFVFAETQMQVASQAHAHVEFAGPLTATASYAGITEFSPAGTYLTELTLVFDNTQTDDITLEATAEQPYRKVIVETIYIDCHDDDGGEACACRHIQGSTEAPSGTLALLFVGLVLAWRTRCRSEA